MLFFAFTVHTSAFHHYYTGPNRCLSSLLSRYCMTSIEQLVISDPTLYRYGSNMSQYASTQMSSCSYNIDAAKLYSHRFYSRYRLPPPPKQPPLPSVHCVLPSLRRPFPNWDEIDHAPASVGMLALTLGRVFGAKAVEVECSFLLPHLCLLIIIVDLAGDFSVEMPVHHVEKIFFT